MSEGALVRRCPVLRLSPVRATGAHPVAWVAGPADVRHRITFHEWQPIVTPRAVSSRICYESRLWLVLYPTNAILDKMGPPAVQRLHQIRSRSAQHRPPLMRP